ncbi:MAG: cysteine protease StiP family protein [Deltaproteobacteria bacterium]|nr:cysteine protease StiP family protein [Deltaproteobacteria bacterium]
MTPPGAFSGSYPGEDVTFLLKVIDLEPLDLETRERLIQSGRSHYSEMIGREEPPDGQYLGVFREALGRNARRLAGDLLSLAQAVKDRPAAGPPPGGDGQGGDLALVSIARSGTPVGVVLARILRELLDTPVTHYSISVIRDKGADPRALDHVLSLHAPGRVVFVDGWTGKGVIARELARSVEAYNLARGTGLDPGLAVITDLCGQARWAAGTDDYLIPSCLLNGVVSGLISRTIHGPGLTGPSDFHGCLFYRDLAPHDLSLWLADRLMAEARALHVAGGGLPRRAGPASPPDLARAREASQAFMAWAEGRFGLADPNHLKPGLGEATRVLLRRSPELLMVRDPGDPDVRHALILARRRRTAVEVRPDLPYRAAALIRRLSPDGGPSQGR